MKRLANAGLIASLLLTSGCFLIFPKSARPPELRQDWVAEADQAKLAAGRELFVAKCAACHDHPDIDAEPAAEWPSIMKEMGEKSKLTAEQTQDVLGFVLAYRNRPGAPVKK